MTQRFSERMIASLPSGFVLPPEIVELIDWLEAQGQKYAWHEGCDFIRAYPVEKREHLWAGLFFIQIYKDSPIHFYRDEAMDARVALFLQTSLDMPSCWAQIALWRGEDGRSGFVLLDDSDLNPLWRPEGLHEPLFNPIASRRFLTDDPIRLIRLLTVGYHDIAARLNPEWTAQEFWRRDDAETSCTMAWPKEICDPDAPEAGPEHPRSGVARLRAWAQERFGIAPARTMLEALGPLEARGRKGRIQFPEGLFPDLEAALKAAGWGVVARAEAMTGPLQAEPPTPKTGPRARAAQSASAAWREIMSQGASWSAADLASATAAAALGGAS